MRSLAATLPQHVQTELSSFSLTPAPHLVPGSSDFLSPTTLSPPPPPDLYLIYLQVLQILPAKHRSTSLTSLLLHNHHPKPGFSCLSPGRLLQHPNCLPSSSPNSFWLFLHFAARVIFQMYKYHHITLWIKKHCLSLHRSKV